jgi:uncharacterized protein
MNKKDIKILFALTIAFLFFYFMPIQEKTLAKALLEGMKLLNDYTKHHILTCLIPAFFIAGGITTFVKKTTILYYLSGKAKKYISYPIASIAGTALAVCSCTILPLFAGIRKRGAGLGPATTFLFAGPAINIAAIFLTTSVLGVNMGIGRIFFAILISIFAGLTMQFIFKEKAEENILIEENQKTKSIKTSFIVLFFVSILGILIINGLAIPPINKAIITSVLILIVGWLSIFKFSKETTKKWLEETWNLSKILLPILFIGVFVTGMIMPFVPEDWISTFVGNNSITGNFIASIFGAFMYFSTLTEVIIIKELIDKGMNQGPALALLLAGPSLSLPNMLVIRRILGNKKTATYILIVIVYSTLAGLLFGTFF